MIGTIILITALLLAPLAALNAADLGAKPNVIVILVDDAGYGDYSCHGNPVAKTPNVD
ncbi:MAG: sulfatase-like hydrolase/transferase, partial [Akkermansiaceae bacterium]|nr:sulfatase-like hydrolase/transferase [Akkermansiaceae bacterium]